MAQSYDVSLKILFALPGHGVIRGLVFGSPVSQYLPTELPQISNRRADLVALTEDGNYHHVEFVSTNDGDMVFRMFYYGAEFMLRFRKPIHQVA